MIVLQQRDNNENNTECGHFLPVWCRAEAFEGIVFGESVGSVPGLSAEEHDQYDTLQFHLSVNLIYVQVIMRGFSPKAFLKTMHQFQ